MTNIYFDKLSPKAVFADKLLTAAGLSLKDLAAAGDVNALKAHIDGLKPADLAGAINTATAQLQQDNAALTAQLAEAAKKIGEITEGRAALAAVLTPLTAALETAGLKLESCNDANGAFSSEKFKAAHEMVVAKSARAFVARAGHPGLIDTIVDDPTKHKQPQAKAPELHGRARYQADFENQMASRHQRN